MTFSVLDSDVTMKKGALELRIAADDVGHRSGIVDHESGPGFNTKARHGKCAGRSRYGLRSGQFPP